jgi:hypothetical protein
VAPGVLILDPTVWLDGARPANTCILPTFPWIKWRNGPPRWCKHHLATTLPPPWVFTHLNHGGQGGACTTLEVNHWSLIQGKEGGIQVLAGLAPSSQTVGSNMRTPGAAPERESICENKSKLWKLITLELEQLEPICDQIWIPC